MPTPVGHSLTALAFAAGRGGSLRTSLKGPWLWLAALSANAADLDFLPGLLLGSESLFHRGASHSIGGAAAFGLAVFALAAGLARSWRTAARASAAAAALYGGHLLLDLFGTDPGPPYGIQVFWPFSSGYVAPPLELFPHLDRHPFDWSVFGRALPVAAAELALIGPFAALAALAARRRAGTAAS